MDRKTIQDATFPKCPIRNILARIGDKWAMLVLYTLEQHGTLRFNDMYRCIPDVSPLFSVQVTFLEGFPVFDGESRIASTKSSAA